MCYLDGQRNTRVLKAEDRIPRVSVAPYVRREAEGFGPQRQGAGVTPNKLVPM